MTRDHTEYAATKSCTINRVERGTPQRMGSGEGDGGGETGVVFVMLMVAATS